MAALMAEQALSLPLLRGSITLEEALDQEEDMLFDVSCPESRMQFFVFLYSHRSDMQELSPTIWAQVNPLSVA